MNMTFEGHTLLDQLQHPFSSYPLLEQHGSSPPKSDKQKGLCIRKKKRATIIIGSVIAVVFICLLAVVAISALLPLFSSSISRSKGATEERLQSFSDLNAVQQPLVKTNQMEPFAGNWILHNQDEHLDSFLKAIGVGFLERLFAPSITSEMDVIIEGPTTVTLEFRILIKTIKATFQLDEEFEFKTVDGRTVMTSHSIEDGAFVTRERWHHGGKEKHVKYIRKIIDDQMVNFMYVDDITSIQKYVRVKK